MGVRHRIHAGIPVIDVEGEFYGDSETDKLRDMIRAEADRGSMKLVLNLYGCRMMNSAALGVMIEAKRTYDAMGGEIRLCGLGHRAMKSLLVTVRLMSWFEISDTETEAIAVLTRARASA